jgi:hypothetical protein
MFSRLIWIWKFRGGNPRKRHLKNYLIRQLFKTLWDFFRTLIKPLSYTGQVMGDLWQFMAF